MKGERHAVNTEAQRMEIEAILEGPEYFTCERTHTRMRKQQCIIRQMQGVPLHGYKLIIPPECVDCTQGREIMAQENREKKMCERCGLKPAHATSTMCLDCHRETKDDRKPLCSDCGQRPATIKGLCEKCYKKRWYKNSKGQRNRAAMKKGYNPPPGPPRETDRVGARDLSYLLEMDFSEYSQVLDRVKQRAKEECRTPAQQALWIIKRHLES